MTTPIKALPSLFKGITFRSRTEARWAVFFEAIGWNWTHEKEGFDLSGEWYLPDFYLADFPMRSEEHTSELQSLMRISYAVFCLKKKTHITNIQQQHYEHTTNKHIRRQLQSNVK